MLKSFLCALQGLDHALHHERNLKIEIVCALLAIALGVYFQLSATEWMILALTMGLVIGAEILNTSIERLTDLASPELHPLAKQAKDTAAGAVLIFVFVSIVVGGILFIPKIF